MRQGNDVGTQYRSAIYTTSDEQRDAAEASRARYQEALDRAGHGRITTEIVEAGPFYYAEPYHQQYLARNPWGYCGIGGTGVACPTGLAATGTDQRRPAPGSLVSRCARATGTRLTTITNSAIAFTTGRFWPCRMKPNMSRGSVFWAPAVKYVTTISSHESANARSAPATSAVPTTGSVT